MVDDDVTLQELIVRALTGRDETARRSLDDAAAADPELSAFCAELRGVVATLAGSTDWRAAAPSAELTAKIRQAVVSRLPAAPPHFKTVLLEADLGRRRAARKIVMVLVLALAVLAAVLVFWQRPRGESERLPLTGALVFEQPLKGEALAAWQSSSETGWLSTPGGLRSAGSNDAEAIVLKNGCGAEKALAFNVDVKIPELDEQSSVTIFIADAEGAAQMTLDTAARPREALALEIASDSRLLTGSGRALLQSRPVSAVGGAFLRVRMEYLGRAMRVTVNNEVFFDGALPRPLQGPLHPGLRVAGPRKNDILFNAVRIER